MSIQHQNFGNVYDMEISCEITVQPNKSMRFRYKSEKTAGHIYGENYSNENQVYPTIKIYNYTGIVKIRISCVTKDPPEEYRPHPHYLVKIKKEVATGTCYEGIFEVAVQNNSDGITFPNLGLHCVKKTDIRKELDKRAKRGVDPFQTGFDHPITDIHCVRLCFEVIIGNRENPIKHFRLVSNPITDVKDLIIYKLSHASGSVEGKEEMLMFVEKVSSKSDNIKIRFYEEQDDEIVWYGDAEFGQSDVHKQYGISFRTPQYRNINITEPVKVKIRLMRTDGDDITYSTPRDFMYRPNETSILKQKRPRITQSTRNQLINDLVASHKQRRYNISEPEYTSSYENFGPPNINAPSTSYSTSSQSVMASPNIPSDQYNITIQSPNNHQSIAAEGMIISETECTSSYENFGPPNISATSTSYATSSQSVMGSPNIPSYRYNIPIQSPNTPLGITEEAQICLDVFDEYMKENEGQGNQQNFINDLDFATILDLDQQELNKL